MENTSSKLSNKGCVKLNEKVCDCQMWQVSGIPCLHALACINTVRAQVEDYCDLFFSVDYWKKCYTGVIHPKPSMNLWPPFENNDLQPPIARPLPGRPKKRRRRPEGEPQPRTRLQSTTKRCGKCNQFGHNRRSCMTNVVRGRGVGGGRGRMGGRGRGANRGVDYKNVNVVSKSIQSTI